MENQNYEALMLFKLYATIWHLFQLMKCFKFLFVSAGNCLHE